MKILIVNKYDKEGGAAIAAYRLHKSLLEAGVHSSMLVQKKISDDYTVIGPVSIKQKLFNIVNYYIDQIPVFFYKKKSANLFSPSWFSFGNILKQINDIKPDVVHLHWVCKGMLSLKELEKIEAPIVWTMHDSWAFTGGCHIPGECKNYISGCGGCLLLGSCGAHDLSKQVFKRKQKLYSQKENITMVAVSKWLQGCAINSALHKGKDIYCIPNAIDTEEFSPVDKKLAKSILNLDDDKKLILFGALSATSDLNKGFKELFEALNQLSCSDIQIAVFGSARPKNEPASKYKIHYLGRLHDSVSLKVLYSAADVMVVPSLMEAFGQTASESMSCGTPVVAFNTSGLVDIVDHKINGYLAKTFDTADLARGMQWVLSAENYNQLSKNAREKVVRQFDSKIVSDTYISLYKSMLSNKC